MTPSSVAVDDYYDTLEDTDYDIENLLSNDAIEGYAYIDSFDENYRRKWNYS